jgi:hypothetical protein
MRDPSALPGRALGHSLVGEEVDQKGDGLRKGTPIRLSSRGNQSIHTESIGHEDKEGHKDNHECKIGYRWEHMVKTQSSRSEIGKRYFFYIKMIEDDKT